MTLPFVPLEQFIDVSSPSFVAIGRPLDSISSSKSMIGMQGVGVGPLVQKHPVGRFTVGKHSSPTQQINYHYVKRSYKEYWVRYNFHFALNNFLIKYVIIKVGYSSQEIKVFAQKQAYVNAWGIILHKLSLGIRDMGFCNVLSVLSSGHSIFNLEQMQCF